MNNKYKSYFFVVLSIGLMLLLSGCEMAVLDPKGFVASEEKRLIIVATLLMLIVVIPVIILTVVFAWKYRATNTKAIYEPNWSHNTLIEVIWWVIPCIIVVILAVITWITSHQLDPYKPLSVKTKPITIEAVALDWKWLFIYPEHNIATVNYIQFPDHVPINFKITADAPMNSFWIPHLGGQIYAMAGMQTKLHLIADEQGEYAGLSSNYSGAGFSGMKFIAKVTTAEDFSRWVSTVKRSPDILTQDVYNQLAKPSENNEVKYYSFVERGLYDAIIMKFMVPNPQKTVEKGHHPE